MTELEKVTSLVFEALAEHFEQIDSDAPLPTSTDAVLFGADAVLDSLGLVNVVVAVEDKLLGKYGREVWLTDERALMQAESPYRTVESLSRYILLLLEEPEEQSP
jgi:D-alanine--poly(phosphoribitol) ligase subunit 2